MMFFYGLQDCIFVTADGGQCRKLLNNAVPADQYYHNTFLPDNVLLTPFPGFVPKVSADRFRR
jgi:hypothetical protein